MFDSVIDSAGMARFSIAALFVSALLLTACDQPAPVIATLPTAGDLDTVPVEPSVLTSETAFDGRIEAINRSTVSAQTSGRIVELPFDVGDYVEAGELIVGITDDEQQAQVERAQAAVAEAQAQRRQTASQFTRVQDIYDKRLIAKAELDAAISNRDAALARLKAAEAALIQARQTLAYTRILAPFPGIVVEKFVELGESVTVGRELMAGLSLSQLRAVVDVPQQHMAAVRDPGEARVILPDGRSVTASALHLPPNADPDSGTFRVRADLPTEDYGVFPGTLVKVAFISGETQRLMLPPGAVARRGEITGVYVLNDADQLQFRYLRVGPPTSDGRVPVLSGLLAGERVASDPVAAAQRYRGAES